MRCCGALWGCSARRALADVGFCLGVRRFCRSESHQTGANRTQRRLPPVGTTPHPSWQKNNPWACRAGHGKGDCWGLQGKLQAQAWAFSGLICFIFDSRLRLFQKRWWRFLCPNVERIAGRPLGGVTCACTRGARRSGPGPAEPGLCSRAAGVKGLEVAALLGVFDAAKPVGAAEGRQIQGAAGF